jgi:[ribosomal protein S18]-alanine N-acetyltransferase
MNTEVTLRPATLDDMPRIIAIDQASFTQPWSRKSFEDALASESGVSLVAENNGALCGYGMAWVAGDEGEIATLAVDATTRGRGIGKRLLNTLIVECAARGARQIFLEVRPSNATARRLYERLGFVEVGLRPQYYADDEAAIIMKKVVSA